MTIQASTIRPLLCGCCFAAASFATLLATPAIARQVPVINQTFDADVELQPGQCVSMPGGMCDIHEDTPVPGWVANGPEAGIFNPATNSYDEVWPHHEVGFVTGTPDGLGWLQQDFGPMHRGGTYMITVQVGCRVDKPCAGFHITVFTNGNPTYIFAGRASEQVPGVWKHYKFYFNSTHGQLLSIRLTGFSRGHYTETDFDNFYLNYKSDGG